MADMKTYKVLLVDDDEDDYILTRDIFSEIPQSAQYKLSWINNYEEAINAMLKSHYDIYLVDYRLGKHTGIDLLNEAIKSNVEEPIIILTGKGDSKVDEDALQIGAADYLVKDQIDPYTIERSIRYAVKHKSTLKALRESENKFRIIFERSKEPFLIIDSLGIIKDVNNSGLEFFGYTKEEFLNLNSSELFHNKQDSVNFSEIMDGKGAVNDFETELKGKQNNTRKVSISAFLQIDQHATKELYYCIVHDITDLKKLEQEYVEQEKTALTERIAKGLANELTNPLSNINLSLEQLKIDSNNLDNSAKDYLEIIQSNFERINNLITTFINATQSLELNLQPRAINILVDESIENIQTHLIENNIKLITEHAQEELFVKVDYQTMVDTFDQVFQNAIASKAHTISLNVSKEQENVVIVVKDDGLGISKQNQRQVFEPFFTSQQKRLGLGLNLVKKTIRNNKGSFSLESEEGEGTTFKIILPIAQPSQGWG